ncbi:hypothetical protein [Sulfurovum mangrovi]|uniref:hypothetical protein n=1 Tax=Sulfurovum mangrovi TaxID=2893889 RepID=UPI001E5AAB69|nr:hypothetical protein [Sulfurovum mangrovi]UFH58484.1 hypothetical protein LN246_08985 [Sulfurovum mangrovi]
MRRLKRIKIRNRIYTILQSMSKEEIEEAAKNIGYDSTKKGLKTLEIFLMHKDICTWVESGYRDSKYTALEFLLKLCELLKIHPGMCSDELETERKFLHDAEKFRSTYINVNTIDNPNPMTKVLDPFESLRVLERPYIDELIGRTDQEIFILISNIIKEHYADNGGRILWGDIVNYTYYHHDKKSYIFDNDGNQIENI